MTATFSLNKLKTRNFIAIQRFKNIKYYYENLQSTFEKSCYRPCSHRSKTAKIKRGRERDSGNSSSYEAYNTIAC
jgi:hypothetical protein